jgi:hypothetical protein
MQAAAAEEFAEESVGEICLRIARELESLRQRGVTLEQSICVHALDGSGGANVADLQEMDFLLQHIAALRDFMSAMSSSMPDNARFDPAWALQRVRLGALRNRLSGVSDAAAASEAPSGEFELF